MKSNYQLIMKNYNFREKENSRVVKERENFHENSYRNVRILWPPRLQPPIRRQKHKTQEKSAHARTWLVGLNSNFECDWLVKLSDNKLPNNKLFDNCYYFRSFLNQSQSRKLYFLWLQLKSYWWYQELLSCKTLSSKRYIFIRRYNHETSSAV